MLFHWQKFLTSFVSKIPYALKIAHIASVFKSGDKNDVKTYCSMSLLPYLSKILEKCMINRLLVFPDKHNVINKQKYGFCQSFASNNADVLDCITYKIFIYHNSMQ